MSESEYTTVRRVLLFASVGLGAILALPISLPSWVVGICSAGLMMALYGAVVHPGPTARRNLDEEKRKAIGPK